MYQNRSQILLWNPVPRYKHRHTNRNTDKQTDSHSQVVAAFSKRTADCVFMSAYVTLWALGIGLHFTPIRKISLCTIIPCRHFLVRWGNDATLDLHYTFSRVRDTTYFTWTNSCFLYCFVITFIHPSIHFLLLIRVRPQWQQARQDLPGLLLTSDAFQLHLCDPKALWSQSG